MGLSTAMYTGLSGLNVNQTKINVIGHNIANVNTTAFQGSRTLFQTQFSQIFSGGTAPNGTTGGVNPTQIGLGAVVGTTQRDITPGSIETTGVPSDMAIEGDGYFILTGSDGRTVYSRDGSFSLDAGNQLVSIDGRRVMGFAVDENFQIVPGTLTPLTLPVGELSIARATGNVQFDGDLSAAGVPATQGSELVSLDLLDGGGGPATSATALTDLRAAADPNTPLFSDGAQITISGVTKGGRALPDATFAVGTDGSTLGDLANWLNDVLGIQTAEGVPDKPGVQIENGRLVVRGNAGEANDLSFANDQLTITGGNVGGLAFSKTQSAEGSSAFTSFTVYDSLGQPHVADLTFTLEDLTDSGPVWRFYAESNENSGPARVLGTGLIRFDNNGNFVSTEGNELAMDVASSGAATPLRFALDFSSLNGLSTAESNVVMSSQDGFPPGTLSGFSVGRDGVINGTFSNGLTRPLGQIAVATFANPQGLVAEGDNLFVQGPNSGEARVVTPGTFGAGTVLGGALEQSNVDLSREFIGLVTASTGFQAASRVISTTSDLLDQLLLIVR